MKKVFYRTNDGKIGHIVGEIKSLTDGYLYFELNDHSFIKYEEFAEIILMTSPEIIELIQPGDYVNNRYVLKKLKNNVSVENSDYVNGIQLISNDEIESVITREEFEKNKYYVRYE